jgi:drug/metabolite transporter (DMT)-like permease
VFFNLVPVFTTALAVTLLGEEFTYHQLFGGIVVLLGVYISTKRPIKNHPSMHKEDLQ